ncbi:GAF and ANTAR domain-containing protein [Promicromonospora sp. NPDC050249]|uniref:GAF and ANTAR domain-containing protein n=1 Tax=Promicromonospora sp. NPDC050249 TaxID=3154743 RepID=UPI0033D13011
MPQLLSLLACSLAKDTVRPWAMRLCEACVDALGAQGGALTVLGGPGERVAVSTPGAFEDLEPLQEVLGEGPVPQAMAEDQPVVTRLGTVVDEYPVFSQLAGPVGGEVTLYAVPMRAGGHVVGVLSLYVTDDPQARSAQDLRFLADIVGASLLGDTELPDGSERAWLHRAAGMVIAQLGIGVEDALAVIRANAFSRSTSLRSVAEDVLERRLTFSLDE